jgi:transcriptional regulator with XRE-family HTH domain
MIDMAQFHNIKFLKEVEGLSQKQIATKLGISRNTVSKYLKENIAPTTILRKTVYGTKDYAPETKRVTLNSYNQMSPPFYTARGFVQPRLRLSTDLPLFFSLGLCNL